LTIDDFRLQSSIDNRKSAIMKTVAVTGSFDNLRSKHVRFLEEAAKWGDVYVGLWSDEAVQAVEGRPPKFLEKERSYLLESLRFVSRVTLVSGTIEPDALPDLEAVRPHAWVVDAESDSPGKRAYAEAQGIQYCVVRTEDLSHFPDSPPGGKAERRSAPGRAPLAPTSTTEAGDNDFHSARKRVIVTGCFDWLHSGHVRFFEEASALGDLYVVVGNDANIRLLKGEGHPFLSEEERLYMVRSIRYVHQAMVSTGHGWLDAEPQLALIQPHLYVVNEDGDKPEKKTFCAEHGIDYVVLKRIPKEGLPGRESTELRGF
jgi:cytidyltransferase-like protein